MKKRYITYTAACLLGLQLFNSCTKDFLEVQPKGSTLESNYYRNATELFNGIIAAYDPLGVEAANSYTSRIATLNSASDDTYAGGGSSSDMAAWQAWNNFTVDAGIGPQEDLWDTRYTGVYRTNLILSKIDGVPDLDATLAARYKAEAKFLRAFYYFDLVRLFGNIPLITGPIATSELFNQEQVAPEAVYAQIEQDLNDAIPDLPNTVPVSTEGGRATKGAAQALLGKVYLYEQKWGQAAGMLAEVNGTPGSANQYGNRLLANFGDIFRPDNEYNSESVFEIAHTAVAQQGWGSWGAFEGNVGVQMIGPRGYSGPTYVAGWGFNPLTLDLVNAIKDDPRYKYTVANIDSIAKNTEGASYEKGYQDTGYFIEKFAPKLEWRATLGDPALNFPHNLIEIRLADTYLMEAEALVQAGSDPTRAAALLNAVRARVGLDPVTATLDNIYNERRLELATEGHRFFDLVRTGQAATKLAFKGFQANKNEVLPIPLAELNNTNLQQNKGY